MRTASFAVVAIAAIALTAFDINTAGAETTASPIAAKDCDFEFTWTRPHLVGPQLIGRGFAWCDEPPEEHIAVLKLEFKPAGRSGWEVAAATKPDRTRPAKQVNYEVSATCYAGSWRAAVDVWGTMQGHPFTFSDRSGSVDVPASRCAPRG